MTYRTIINELAVAKSLFVDLHSEDDFDALLEANHCLTEILHEVKAIIARKIIENLDGEDKLDAKG